jgi:phosphoglucomutase
MTMAFHKLRHSSSSDRISYIQSFGLLKIERIHDVSLDYNSTVRRELPEDKPVLPSAEMISFELEDGTVMTLRGSGTEPKLKYYIEAKANSFKKAQEKAKMVEEALLGVFRAIGMGV